MILKKIYHLINESTKIHNTASTKLESILNLKLPLDYKQFIDETGYMSFDNISIEVYGYKLGWELGTPKYPCVIATTQLNRDSHPLKDDEIVISEPGYDTFLTVLNTKTGIVEYVSHDGRRKKVATSFSNWLKQMKIENEEN